MGHIRVRPTDRMRVGGVSDVSVHGGGFGDLVFERAPIATILVDAGRIVAANEAARTLLGVPAEGLLDRRLLDFVGEPDRSSVRSRLRELEAGQVRPDRLAVELRVDHAVRPVDLHLAAHDSGVVLAQLVTHVATAAAELRAERAFRSTMLELQLLVHDSVDDREFYATLIQRAVEVIPGAQFGSILVRQPGTWRYEFEAAVGFDLDGLRRFPILGEELFRDDEDTRARVVTEYPPPENAAPERVRWWLEDLRLGELRASVTAPVHLDGEPVAIFSVDNLDDPDAFGPTSVEMATVLGRLITDLLRRRGLEAELRAERAAYRHQAMHDGLTGLANRRHFEQRLAEVLALSDPSGIGVFFVDVDDFKRINDEHGHDGGDEVLMELGRRLTGTVRSSDLVARWGGDEFVILTFGIEESQADALAERLVRRCAEPVPLTDGTVVRTGVTAGIAWSASPTVSDDLLLIADGALFRAKAEGKGCHDLVAL
ncbi:MAG: sensor domain-containing diguanylate cyclase [Actinomycetota bacterium]